MTRHRFLLVLALIACLAPGGFAGFKGARYKVRRPAARTSDSKERRTPDASLNVLEFQVTADEPFPVRALDPVLHVGDYEVRDFRYANMENTSIVFTCSEADKLKDGAAVYLQYENDTHTRTDLPEFRFSMVQ